MSQSPQHPEGTPRQSRRRELAAWAVFDWANSAFFTVILTFVFAAYFTRQVVADDVDGTRIWGTAIGLSGLLVALTGPLLGAITDQTQRRKPWLIGLVVINVLATAGLWWVYPGAQGVWLGAMLAALAAFAIELAIILYNAMLPDLAGREGTARWSGWGWALGYAGGLCCLVAVLVLFVQEGFRLPWLTTDEAGHLRASFVFVAVWVGVFSLPLILLTRDPRANAKPMTRGVADGWQQLITSVRQVRQYAHIVRFLIARIFYVDGLATMFAMGGVYAAGTFDMDETSILYFGIALNVTAGIGAFGFSWVDERIGSRPTILIALGALIVSSMVMLSVQQAWQFWVAGMVLGIFVGPVQAASRSYMAHVAPPDLKNQMFGLFTFSGKATAFLGPLLVGWITVLADSQRWGMSTIVVLFVIGFVVMLTVPAAASASAESASAESESAEKPDSN